MRITTFFTALLFTSVAFANLNGHYVCDFQDQGETLSLDVSISDNGISTTDYSEGGEVYSTNLVYGPIETNGWVFSSGTDDEFYGNFYESYKIQDISPNHVNVYFENTYLGDGEVDSGMTIASFYRVAQSNRYAFKITYYNDFSYNDYQDVENETGSFQYRCFKRN